MYRNRLPDSLISMLTSFMTSPLFAVLDHKDSRPAPLKRLASASRTYLAGLRLDTA